VVLDGRSQSGLVAEVADPSGQLRVPDESMPTHGLVVLRSPVYEVVGLGQGEGALGPLGALPLHAVLGRQLAEVGFDDGRVLPGRQATLVAAGTEIQLALGLHERVDALRRLAGADLGSWGRHRGQRGEEEEDTGLHDVEKEEGLACCWATT